MNQPVRFTLEDWKGLSGCIASEAKDTRDKRLKRELDRLYARIRNLLEGDRPPTTLKLYRGEDESGDDRGQA